MPVISRIDWISRQLEYGRIIHIVAGRAYDPNKLKFKIVLHPADAGTLSDFVHQHLASQLMHLRELVQSNVSTDRGHKHSKGFSEVSI